MRSQRLENDQDFGKECLLCTRATPTILHVAGSQLRDTQKLINSNVSSS